MTPLLKNSTSSSYDLHMYILFKITPFQETSSWNIFQNSQDPNEEIVTITATTSSNCCLVRSDTKIRHEDQKVGYRGTAGSSLWSAAGRKRRKSGTTPYLHIKKAIRRTRLCKRRGRLRVPGPKGWKEFRNPCANKPALWHHEASSWEDRGGGKEALTRYSWG